MREIFSVRFFAAVGAVAALLFLVSTVIAARAVVDDVTGDDADEAAQPRRVDLVERIESSSTSVVGLDGDGLSVGTVDLTIDASRRVRIAPGTPGVLHCQPSAPGACAIVADLLGEAVVWFALVPMGASATSVQFPAIDTLDEGVATLVNGWQLRYAPVLDRRCTDAQGNDEEYDSYREFREVFGADFVSVLDIPSQRLVAVVCRARVPYAPATGSTLPGAPAVPSTGVAPLDTAPVATPVPATTPPTLPPDSTVVNEG